MATPIVAVISIDRSNPTFGAPSGSSIYDQARGRWMNALESCRQAGAVLVLDRRIVIGLFEVEKWGLTQPNAFETRPASQFQSGVGVMFWGAPFKDPRAKKFIGMKYSGKLRTGAGFCFITLDEMKAACSPDVEQSKSSPVVKPVKVAYAW